MANELCFKTVGPTIPIPVRDVDLYTNRGRLLKTSKWKINLRKAFVEYDILDL